MMLGPLSFNRDRDRSGPCPCIAGGNRIVFIDHRDCMSPSLVDKRPVIRIADAHAAYAKHIAALSRTEHGTAWDSILLGVKRMAIIGRSEIALNFAGCLAAAAEAHPIRRADEPGLAAASAARVGPETRQHSPHSRDREGGCKSGEISPYEHLHAFAVGELLTYGTNVLELASHSRITSLRWHT